MFRSYIAIIALTVSCVTVPDSNRRAMQFIPDSQMNSMGEQAWADILKKEKRSKDKKMTKKVVEIGRRIAKASGAKFKWEFALIDAPKVMNAFCLPGGKIAVYTGILKVAKNNAGLAAILGHEVAHAVAKHSAERMSQAVIVQFGMAALDELTTNSKYKPLIMGSLGLGAQFGIMMPFSRMHESEADQIGLKYMSKAGYDPKEAPALWKRMTKGGRGVPEFLSTHPAPNARAEALKGQISDVLPLYNKSNKQKTVSL